MLREYISQDIFIGFIVLSFILIASVKQLFTLRFIDFVAVIWNDRYLKLYQKDRKKLDIFNVLLFLNFVIALGIFVFELLPFLGNLTIDSVSVLPILFLAIALISIIKLGLERLVGYFFDIHDIIKTYIFQKITYKNILGLILVPVNILLLFSSLDKKVVIFTGIILFFLVNLSGFIRFLKVYQKAIFTNFFYFLLYLCALEIGPYVILYKVFKDNFV
ncbi:uncharacterized protein DUF4271 [Winogradskyella wandonensis]|uniref:Uncharacterized protein DUF4271 n=1 Tax=Winogradskyella wandonensis TaxID=1442586 RepID=A0A4R1KK65_9FLAO|nr:DUF4271 domain-containing protein [Winogradskyella wandonensis]TCK65132.1 uncharacterized protein DUF4271 [Winogradskyella wandonensis]